MFHSARLTLTAWYLLIIMLVSLMFSAAIYRVLTSEINRFARAQQFRIERQLQEEDFFQPGGRVRFFQTLPMDNPELLAEIKNRILFALVVVNGIILVLAGGFGYVLAGRTLQPIVDMMDEQNRFISDASHELRTPLTSLKSAFEVYLRDKKATLPEAKKLITESITDVNKLQSLSESLLQLAQYEKPNGHTRFEKISLAFIIEQAVHNIKPIADAKTITVTNSLLDVEVMGNKYALIDLFVILLDNAVKYSRAGEDVAVAMKKTEKSVSVAIQDHGVGIDTKDLPHIFDRFYRADTARSKSTTSGYGLGLSIAKKIVTQHKGSITVTSVPKKGSVFTVRLPA